MDSIFAFGKIQEAINKTASPMSEERDDILRTFPAINQTAIAIAVGMGIKTKRKTLYIGTMPNRQTSFILFVM